MLDSISPIIAVFYFLFFIKNNRVNTPFVGLIFLSYLFFATNYTHYGLEVDIYRYLHRAIGVLIVILLGVHIVKNKVKIYKDPVAIVLTAFFIVLLISTIGNELHWEHYIHYVRNFVFVACIVMYLYLMLDSQEKLNELYRLIVGLTVILAFLVFVEVLQYGWSRVALFYSNPNYLGYAMLPGLVISVFVSLKYRWLSAVLILFAIFATGSNSAEIGAVFALFLLIIKNVKRINKVHIIIGIILSVLLISNFDRIVLNKDINSTRIALSKLAINAFQENPVNGIGYGQFRTSFINYIDDSIKNINNHEINYAILSYQEELSDNYLQSMGIVRNMEKMTHSDLMTIVSELGLFGILFIFWVFYQLYFVLKRIKLDHSKEYFLSIGLLGASLMFSLFHNNLTSFVFWFVLLLPFIINRNINKPES